MCADSASVAARMGLRAPARAARVHVSRRSMARFVDGLARGRADGLLAHEFHGFRPAAAHALHQPRGVVCVQRWCRADCRVPHPPALEGGRMSAAAQPRRHLRDPRRRPDLIDPGSAGPRDAVFGPHTPCRHGISWIPHFRRCSASDRMGARRLRRTIQGKPSEQFSGLPTDCAPSDSFMAMSLRWHDSLWRDHLSAPSKTTAE